MDDDLDTPSATALLFDTVRRANAALDAGDAAAAGLVAAAREIAATFGLVLGAAGEVPTRRAGQGARARRCSRRQGLRHRRRAPRRAPGRRLDRRDHRRTARRCGGDVRRSIDRRTESGETVEPHADHA